MIEIKSFFPIVFFCICTNLFAQNTLPDYTSLESPVFDEVAAAIDYSTITGSSYELKNYSLGTSHKNTSLMYLNDGFNDMDEKLNMEYPFRGRRHPLEKTGRILTYIGVPLAIIGGIMVAGADDLYYECVNGNCSGDARGGFGVVILGAGAGMAGTGTVLWIIGSKK